MLHFNDSYFKEEIRCGFTIPEIMKRVWAAETEVLAQVIFICQKYGLKYYADWGTLLGAVRHQGFIPWDDDVDISLKRADYIKLLSVLKKELPAHYRVSSLYTEGDHKQPIACVMNGAGLPLDKDVKEKFYDCPYIVGVDIYPLDYIPRNKELAETQITLYNVVYDLGQRFCAIEKEGNLEKYLLWAEELCNVRFERNEYLRKQIWQLSDRICSMFSEEESDELTWFPRIVKGDVNYRLKKEWYAKTIEKPFENISVAIPEGYHEILKKKYGDYSKYVRGSAHNYPFYKRQEEYLRSLNE